MMCSLGGLGEIEVEGLLVAYEGGGPSTLRRGGLLPPLSSKLQSSPSALAIEDEKVSPVEGLCSGINPDAELLDECAG